MSDIEMHSLLKKCGLVSTIATMRDRKNSIDRRMRNLSKQLRMSDIMDENKINEYVQLNKESRKVRIFEAELMYLRNIL